MKLRKLVRMLLIFIICVSITTVASAEENSNENNPVEEVSIRVIEHETYLEEVAAFNELIKDVKDEDILKDDYIILSPEEFTKRMEDYQSAQSSKGGQRSTGYGGLGGYLSGDYFHVLTHYSSNTSYMRYEYKKLGYVRLVNNGTSPAELKYVQSETVSVSGSLSLSSTLSTSVKADVFGIAEVEAGLSVSLSASVTAGTSYATQTSGTVEVPAGETRRITAYKDGVYVGGTAYYNVYDESNGYPGVLIDQGDARPASDNVIVTNSVSLVISMN